LVVAALYLEFLPAGASSGADDKVRRLEAGLATVESLVEELIGSSSMLRFRRVPAGSTTTPSTVNPDPAEPLDGEGRSFRTGSWSMPERGGERSNSYDLMTFGWRGIPIEANPARIRESEDFAAWK
jgi:hypothetical protein